MPLGSAGFADDTAPRDALVAVPLPPGSDAPSVEAAGVRWVLGASLADARARGREGAGAAHDRGGPAAAARFPTCPVGGVRLATSWVEPAYLEPDASWCEPGGEPASPLANGGAFGGKVDSPVAAAARELADRHGRSVRTVFSREDVVRLGPKRPPMAASAVLDDGRLVLEGRSVGRLPFESLAAPFPLDVRWEVVTASGPAVSTSLRAVGLAEGTVLVQGALAAAGVSSPSRSAARPSTAWCAPRAAPAPAPACTSTTRRARSAASR